MRINLAGRVIEVSFRTWFGLLRYKMAKRMRWGRMRSGR